MKILKEIREAQGLSRNGLAQKAGLSISNVRRIERGDARSDTVGDRTLYALADALGESPVEIERAIFASSGSPRAFVSRFEQPEPESMKFPASWETEGERLWILAQITLEEFANHPTAENRRKVEDALAIVKEEHLAQEAKVIHSQRTKDKEE